MVLEAPLFMANPTARVEKWRSSKDFADLRVFRCQGISVSRLMARVKKAGENDLAVSFQVRLFNPDNNHDKAVRVVVALRNGEETIGTASFGPVKVEESDSVTREVSITVPASSLKTDPFTTLQLTLTAVDK